MSKRLLSSEDFDDGGYKKQATEPDDFQDLPPYRFSRSYSRKKNYKRSKMPRRYRRSYPRRRVSSRAIARGIAKQNLNAKYGVYYDRVDKKWTPRSTNTTLAQFGKTRRDATRDQILARRAHGYKGLGDYSTLWQQGRKYIPRALGAGAGYLTGQGVQAGWDQGATVSKFLGWGDYGPAINNQIMPGGNMPLEVNPTEGLTGDIYFSHSEFLGNICPTSTEFELKQYPINPGLKTTFPFLSQIARNFTMYEFHGLIFEYRPTSGELGSTNNALGKIIMATDYDPDSPPFLNSANMANYDYATTSKPSLTARHGVETAPNQQAVKMQYVRTEDNPSTRDKIFTDVGLFQIASEGIPQPGCIGELWVAYKVKLSRAQITPTPTWGHYSASRTSAGSEVSLFGESGDREYSDNGAGVAFTGTTMTFPHNTTGKSKYWHLVISTQWEAGTTLPFTSTIEMTIPGTSITFNGYFARRGGLSPSGAILLNTADALTSTRTNQTYEATVIQPSDPSADTVERTLVFTPPASGSALDTFVSNSIIFETSPDDIF